MYRDVTKDDALAIFVIAACVAIGTALGMGVMAIIFLLSG